MAQRSLSLFLLILFCLNHAVVAQSSSNSAQSASQTETPSASIVASEIVTTFTAEPFAASDVFYEYTSLPSRTGAAATVTFADPIRETDVSVQEAYVISLGGGPESGLDGIKYFAPCWFPVSVSDGLPQKTPRSMILRDFRFSN